MSQILVALIICALTAVSSYAEDNMAMLRREGLTGRITYRVADEMGSPVSNASVQVSFQNDSIAPPPLVLGKTDTNGMFTAESRVQLRANTQVTKNGFYCSRHHYTFFTIDQSRMKEGKWLPWNPTVEITLYPERNRRKAPKRHTCYYEHLEQNTDYGFDMLKKDVVMPGKKGDTADFRFRGIGLYKVISGEEPRDTKIFYTNDVEVAFQNEGDGVARMKKHRDSEFKFTYTAPETGYEQKVHFHSDYSRQGRISTFPSDDEYLIFRVSRKNEASGETKQYYGIITRFVGGVDRKGELGIDIWYYLNPDPEDRNIEYLR